MCFSKRDGVAFALLSVRSRRRLRGLMIGGLEYTTKSMFAFINFALVLVCFTTRAALVARAPDKVVSIDFLLEVVFEAELRFNFEGKSLLFR